MRWLALLLLTGSALADEATVTWDHSDPTHSFRLYLDDTPLSEHADKTAVITLPPAGGVLTVTAFNAQAESAMSSPVVIPATPTNVTVTVTFGAP